MNSKEQEVRERGDSDDEIAELRFQALLTKKENEAEVSPSRKPLPVEDNSVQRMMNQPLSNFRGQQGNYRGRGSGYYKPYLQTFSQQIASKSVNSNNIVVLTSSEPEDNKQPYNPEWGPGGGEVGKGARWPKGEGRGQMRGNAPPMAGSRQAPPLVLPQDKYANQSGSAQTPGEQNKLKLSARMRRLQGSDSDSEDSDTDSSDDSSSSSSSDSDSSSDSSSSDSDSESDNSQEVAKKVEKSSKKDKLDTAKHASQASAKHEENSHNSHSNSSKKVKSPVKMTNTKQGLPSETKKVPQSPTYRNETSRSPLPRRRSRSPSGPYPAKVKPLPPRARRSHSFSPRTRRYSRSPPHRPRTPVRRYGSRSPPPRYRGSHSPGRPARNPKSPPPPLLKKLNSKSPPSARPRSSSRSPYFAKRYKSRSPYLQKRIRSPLRRSSRSPLPPRRLSRSPLAGRLRSRSPLGPKRYGSRSPRPLRRYGSVSPPGRAYNSRSPYSIRRYGSRSPQPYPKRLSPASPKRYRSPSPRNIRPPPPYKDYRLKPLGIVGKGSPPRRRKSSFSPPTKRYGSRSPLRSRISPRGRRSPVFCGRDRTPTANLSSPQRIKRIGSFSPQPSGGQSPFRRFKPRSPPIRRYGTPPPRRISPGVNMRMEHMPEAGMPKSSPYIRTISPRGHNYTSRSPSPYHRGRYSPGMPISARNIPPDTQNPPFYEPRLDHYHGKSNRNMPFEKEIGFPKRFPNDQNPPWLPHKSELISPMKQPPLIHHYPPKFADVEFDTRPGYLPPAPHHQQMQEKGWTPGGPMGRGFNNFGNGRGGHPRIERLDLSHPPPLLGERGRGGRPTRGGRGQRGTGRGGVHARLGRGNAWSAQLQGQQGNYEHPPQLFSDPYIRDRPSRPGALLTSPEQGMEYMGRKPPPFDNLKPIPQSHSRNSHSPGLQRIPRGPKTPPYSPPRRETSPNEYEKRARGNIKLRTPSLSPVSQSPKRYSNEGALRKQSRERKDGDPRSNSENVSSNRQVHYPARSRSPIGKHEQRFNEPHGNREDMRRDNSREVDEKRKPVRVDANSLKHKDYKKESISESKASAEDTKTSMREKDRRDDGRQKSPYQPKTKGSNVHNNNSLGKNKEYEGNFKPNRERDVRSRQDTEDVKGRKDNTEDAKGKREAPEHKGRRENEEPKRKRENEEYKVKKDDEHKGKRNEDELKGRRDAEEHRGRRDNLEDRNVRKEAEERFGGRKDRESDNRSAEKKKTENEREAKVNNNVKERKDTVNRENVVKRVERKPDRNIEKSSMKVHDKPKEIKHADEKREDKELSEHVRNKDVKEKVNFHDEKKKKKKKHREEDRSRSSKKKKKEKKKKKDSKKQKKKLKEPEIDQQIKKKKPLEDDRELAASKPDDLRHALSKRDDSGTRDKGGPKRKENTIEEDREGKKRKKEEPLMSAKEDWKWRGRENERWKEDRQPLPTQSRERDRERMYTGDKQGNEAGRGGGKGLLVTVNPGVDRHVISRSNSSKDAAKRETSRLPVHMRLSGKCTTSDKPSLVNKSGGPMKTSTTKGGRIGDTIGGGMRRKGGPQSSLHRQGMKRTKVTNR